MKGDGAKLLATSLVDCIALENSGLLGSDAVSLGQGFRHFERKKSFQILIWLSNPRR